MDPIAAKLSVVYSRTESGSGNNYGHGHACISIHAANGSIVSNGLRFLEKSSGKDDPERKNYKRLVREI